MPLTDIDPNVNGRDSRASNVSGTIQKRDGLNNATRHVKSDMNSTAPGVLSMLKTTTESGDIGTLSLNQTWHPKAHHGQPRRQNGPTPSRTSSHYSRTGSIHSKASGASLQDYNGRGEVWPYIHPPFANSQEFHNSNPEMRLISGQENILPFPPGVSDRADLDRRTYSLTQNSNKSRHLSSHRSVSSLRSQGPPPSLRTPRNYTARLRRPVPRPSSPALSDSVAASSGRTNLTRPGISLRSHTSTPTQLAQTGQFHSPRSLNTYNFPSPPNASPNQTLHGITNLPADGWRAKVNIAMNDYFPPCQRMQPSQLPPPPNPILARPPQPFKQCPSPLSVEQTNTIMSESQPQRRTDSTPYAGFVQRVKDILEEKSTPENTVRIPRYDSPNYIYDLPRHISELPGSTVKNRLTREMIKAAVGPSSDEGVMSSPNAIHSIMFNNHTVHYSNENSSTQAKASHDSEKAKPTPERFDYQRLPESDATASPSSSIRSMNPKMGRLTNKVSLPAISEPQLEPSEVSITGRDVADIPSPSAWIAPSLSIIPERSSDQPSTPLDVFDDDRGRPKISNTKLVSEFSPNSITAAATEKDGDERAVPVINNGDEGPGEDSGLHGSGIGTMLTSKDFDTNAQTTSQSQSDDDLLSSEVEVAKVVRLPATPHQSLDIQVLDPARGSRSAPAYTPVFRRSENVFPPVITRSASGRPNRQHSTRNSLLTEGGETVSTAYESGGATTDIRMSVVKQFQFPLSDLTEDSQEDASTTNLRMLGAKPPVLRGSGARTARPEPKGVERTLKKNTEPPRSYLSRQISHTRGIPSFHFSRNDLTAKLNVALGIRNSISLENLSSRRNRNRFGNTLERCESSSLLHDRYMSFFSETEDAKPNSEPGDAIVSTAAAEESGNTEVIQKRQEIISEIERLSIPSVNGLTLRLSEFFPLLNSLNEATKSEGDEAADVEQSSSRELDLAQNTLASVISAAAAAKKKRRSGNVGVENGTAEAPIKERGALRLMKDLPPLPKDDSRAQLNKSSKESNTLAEKSSIILKDKVSALSELEATVPIEMDTKSAEKPAELQAGRSLDPANEPCANVTSDCDDQHARLRSTENVYPWSQGTAPYIDINLTRQAQNANGSPAPRSRLNKSRASKSVDTLNDEDELRIARSMSPGPHVETSLIPRSNNVSIDSERPDLARKGLIGSLQRKIGLKPRIDRSGFAIDPAFLHPEERATEPGDRYPTSGLTPPAGLNIEVENRSYFSDDSSEGSKQPARASQTLKKRLTHLRKRPASRPLSPKPSQTGSNRKVSWTAPAVNGGSVFDDSQPDTRLSNSNEVYVVEQEGEEEEQRPPAGMSKVEFRAKMVIHRLRKLWYKSGYLLRSMSRNKKQQQPTSESSC